MNVEWKPPAGCSGDFSRCPRKAAEAATTTAGRLRGLALLLALLGSLAGIVCLTQMTTWAAPGQDAARLTVPTPTENPCSEPNNKIGRAYGPISCGNVLECLIEQEGDQDYYWMDVTEPITLAIDLTDIPADCDWDLYLYDQNGEEVESSVNSSNDPEHIEYFVGQAGRYYIMVEGFSGHSLLDTYKLSVQCLGGTVPTPTATNAPSATIRPSAYAYLPLVMKSHNRGVLVPTSTATFIPTATQTETAIPTATGTPTGTSTPSGSDPLVYITVSGNKYHRADCRYVGSEATAVTCSWARSHGYTACSVCDPYCP